MVGRKGLVIVLVVLALALVVVFGFGDSFGGDVQFSPKSSSGKHACADSDGGLSLGKSKFVFGMANYSKKGVLKKTEFDRCYNSLRVREFYCNKKGRLKSKVLSCGGGNICVAGRCVNETHWNWTGGEWNWTGGGNGTDGNWTGGGNGTDGNWTNWTNGSFG